MYTRSRAATGLRFGFSALQRAENSSIVRQIGEDERSRAFQCSSASRKFLNSWLDQLSASIHKFQCSSASRKFLNRPARRENWIAVIVSVLFSEPKIPQLKSLSERRTATTCFSALQRAENSSIRKERQRDAAIRGFSALQRAENSSILTRWPQRARLRMSFSALQRAENSSIDSGGCEMRIRQMFQCSSASRKFLNLVRHVGRRYGPAVSVLFSEPKIPQWRRRNATRACCRCFSALQRAENSSISPKPRWCGGRRSFQCSSASRKFLNEIGASGRARYSARFSALQRAENSSICVGVALARRRSGFSALQRAENSSM